MKDRHAVSLVDLPINGRATRVVWHKRRFFCPDVLCPMGSWSEVDTRIGFPRLLVTDRAGRWLTRQIGENGRSVQEIADELGCDWHTVNDTLLRYGEALVDDDPTRFGVVSALDLNEVSQAAACDVSIRPRSQVKHCVPSFVLWRFFTVTLLG